MADYDSSLPVRTEDAGDVIAKIADATTPSQQLAVAADGSIAVTDNAGSLTVDAVDLDIRDLVFATDKVDASGSEVSLDAPTLAALESITVQNPAGASAVNIQDGGNSITVDAVDLDVRDLVFATDKVDVTGSSVTVTATQLDIDNLNATDDAVAAHLFDEAGVAFSAANPLPVVFEQGFGTEVNNYNTAAAVAGGATSNHDLVITGDFLLKRVLASASGKLKIEVQVDTGLGYNTVAVAFNSTANPNIVLEFAPVQLANTDDVRIIRTNRDNQAQDVYSTIVGVLI